MRIRQIRPEFFTDPVTAHLSPAVQVTYIGLWCVADDAGWLVWDVPQLGALLSPYKSVRVRERAIEQAGAVLVEAGRLVLKECGCAHIPTLTDHQRIGGNKSFPVRDAHRVHTSTDVYARNVTVGNGMERNVTREADASGAASLKERVAANGLRPDFEAMS